MPLRVPLFHHEKHEDDGADEIDVTGLAGGYSITDLRTDHPLLSGDELHDPKSHKATHEPTGDDEINDVDIGNTGVLLSAHAARHENGEDDEISVAGLSGELADNQPPKAHKATHEPTGADEINDVDIGDTGVLLSAHAARHESGGDDEVTAATAVHGADKHTDVTRDLVLELFPYTAAGGALHTEGAFGAYAFATNDTGMAYFKGKVPDNFVSFTDCNVIWMGKGNTAGQDWHMRTRLLYSAVGEAYNIHSEAPSDQVLDVTVLEKKYATDPGFSFTNLAKGDMIYVQIQRKGFEGDDNYDGRIYIDYVLITYTAEQ